MKICKCKLWAPSKDFDLVSEMLKDIRFYEAELIFSDVV